MDKSKISMFVAGMSLGAIIDSIMKNMPILWTCWLIALMIWNLYYGMKQKM